MFYVVETRLGPYPSTITASNMQKQEYFSDPYKASIHFEKVVSSIEEHTGVIGVEREPVAEKYQLARSVTKGLGDTIHILLGARYFED